MVAAGVDALGIPMRVGPRANPSEKYDNWEDKQIQDILHGIFPVELLSGGYFPRSELQHQIEAGRHGRASEVVANFKKRSVGELAKFRHVVTSRQGSWGWKYPGTVLWLLETGLLEEVRNPHVITIFRDPLAIWQRETSVGLKPTNFQNANQGFRYAAVQVEMLVGCSTTLKSPQLVVSYERATRDDPSKTSLAEGIRSFLQLPEDSEHLTNAIQSMTRPSS